MAEVALFHSAQGLRPGVVGFADDLRKGGHVVHTPDLFDGAVFERLDEGIAFRDEIGIPELIRRAGEAVAELPPTTAMAGFSMGASAAAYLAAHRPEGRGHVQMHAAIPPRELGVDAWPPVPVQVHFAVDDPWVDADELRSLSEAVRAAGVDFEEFSYPGDGHLFADPDLPEYDEASSQLMRRRVLAFLSALDGTA
jgi:dienelactone hydrolase